MHLFWFAGAKLPRLPSVSRRIVTISPEQASEQLSHSGHVPLEQLPGWALTSAWRHRWLGFFDGDRLVAATLVLERHLPRLPWFLAYLPEGPLLEGTLLEGSPPEGLRVDDLDRLADHLRHQGAFMVKIGPRLVTRRWSAGTIRAALGKATGGAQRWRDLAPDAIGPGVDLVAPLEASGWLRYEAPGPGFGGTYQPRHGFELDLRGRDADALLAGMNPQWRRNVRKAAKAGVTVSDEGAAGLDDFHRLLQASGSRRGFPTRERAWFSTLWSAMDRPGSSPHLFVARHQGQAVGAMLAVRHADRLSYTHGGSSDRGRDLRASNALLWCMTQHALASGADLLDLRGASDGLTADAPEVGLSGFKAGLGADAVEYLGEWDRITRPWLGVPFRWWWNRRPH